jgi:hypothetical protein
MICRVWRAVLSLAVLVGCTPEPGSYPIPPQHQAPSGRDAGNYTEFVAAADPWADKYIIKDITGLEGTWRWTGPRPEIRLVLGNAGGRSLQFDFTIADATFKDTGPLTISFLVNGKVLQTITFDKPGEKTFIRRVPDAWLVPGGENRVGLEVKNPWRAPDDGVLLGVLFRGAGFIR